MEENKMRNKPLEKLSRSLIRGIGAFGKHQHRNKMLAMLLIGLAAVPVMLLTTGLVDSRFAPLTFSSEMGCDVTVTFLALDEFGNIVQKPILFSPFSLTAGGVIIESFDVTIDWSAAGTYVDWETLKIWGNMEIHKLDWQGVEDQDLSIPSHYFVYEGEIHKTGSVSFTIMVEDILNGLPNTYEMTEGEYWDLKFDLTVYGSINDVSGTEMTANTGEISKTVRLWDIDAEFYFT